MTNLAFLLCIAGSTVGLRADTEGFGPRTTGRPIDGTVQFRSVADRADVRLQFKQKPTTTASTQPSPPLPNDPPKSITFKGVPESENEFCIVAVNSNLLTRPVTVPSDLAQISGDWAWSVRAFDNLTSLRESRYLLPILGSAKRPRLRLYIFWAVLEKGGLVWKLEKSSDAQFN